MATLTLLRYVQGTLPELILALAICAVILLDMFTPLRRSRAVCGTVALLGVGLALVVVLMPHTSPHLNDPSVFGSMLTRDGLARFFKGIFLLGAAATILFSMRSSETAGYRQGEYFSLLLGATLGACLLAAARHFILFILALETLSMCSYVLAGFIKHERRSAEAGLKYLLYGAVASGVMIFGISYLYGLTGTLLIPDVLHAFNAQPGAFGTQLLPLTLALLLVLVGLGFKVAMVPFQFWCPDVYQGSPTPVTAYLSVVSKAAGFAALLRVFLPLFDGPSGAAVALQAHLPLLFGILAAVTMTFGNLVAMRQTDVKRLLAYSSISHAGYMLIGMTVFNHTAAEAILFYFFMYLLMNLGIFWCVIVLIERLGGPEIERFRGARTKAPFLFWVTFIFLISLMGVPPTAGFVAKFNLFAVPVQEGLRLMKESGAMSPAAWGYFILAAIGALNSVFAAFYYLRIAKVMGFETATDDHPIPMSLIDCALALVFVVPVLALLYFTPVMNLVKVF